ncbi:hypothetical protein [Shewanella sp. YIC-542]|uniref:hypothetical protein n=1 Tax=Shewanella mytili TaxID=3377111 RepID=UPI00398F3DFA
MRNLLLIMAVLVTLFGQAFTSRLALAGSVTAHVIASERQNLGHATQQAEMQPCCQHDSHCQTCDMAQGHCSQANCLSHCSGSAAMLVWSATQVSAPTLSQAIDWTGWSEQTASGSVQTPPPNSLMPLNLTV